MGARCQPRWKFEFVEDICAENHSTDQASRTSCDCRFPSSVCKWVCCSESLEKPAFPPCSVKNCKDVPSCTISKPTAELLLNCRRGNGGGMNIEVSINCYKVPLTGPGSTHSTPHVPLTDLESTWSSTQTTHYTPPGATNTDKLTSSNAGAIAGGVVGGLVLLGAVGLLIFLVFWRRRNSKKDSQASVRHDYDTDYAEIDADFIPSGGSPSKQGLANKGYADSTGHCANLNTRTIHNEYDHLKGVSTTSNTVGTNFDTGETKQPEKNSADEYERLRKANQPDGEGEGQYASLTQPQEDTRMSTSNYFVLEKKDVQDSVPKTDEKVKTNLPTSEYFVLEKAPDSVPETDETTPYFILEEVSSNRGSEEFSDIPDPTGYFVLERKNSTSSENQK